MVRDKSLFHYGRLYNKLIDPLTASIRRRIVDVIPSGASVLDVGCGTGLLCYGLREKGCRVVGIDLSVRMLDFARSNSPYDDVEFVHQDGTALVDFRDESFDYTVIALVIHELDPADQEKMVREVWRVGRNNVYVDSASPLPWNVPGLVKRAIEMSFGSDHYPQFKRYLGGGGVVGVLEATGLEDMITRQDAFLGGTNELVVVSRRVGRDSDGR